MDCMSCPQPRNMIPLDGMSCPQPRGMIPLDCMMSCPQPRGMIPLDCMMSCPQSDWGDDPPCPRGKERRWCGKLLHTDAPAGC